MKKDFFKRHDIRIIEAMPNGKDYVLFYLKLLLESIDHDGTLRFSDTIPYDEQMLSIVTNTNIDIVRSALKLFCELSLVEIMDDQTIFLQEVESMIGDETDWAAKKRAFRQEKINNALQIEDISRTKKDNVRQEIEIEKEIDKELEKEIEHSAKSRRFCPPTVDEVSQYCQERHNGVCPQAFIDFYLSKNWMIGKNKMKDWKASVRTWEQREQKNAPSKQNFAGVTYTDEQLSKFEDDPAELVRQMKGDQG
jgi:predicted phage replisome organizer